MKKTIKISIDPQGWVKLQRSLLESPIMKNPTLLQIYIWSILKANHQPKWFSIKIGKGIKEVFCDVGQFITGRNRAAEELSMPGSTFYKNIKKLEDYGYLTIESNNHFSLITVVNYGSDAPEIVKKEQPIKANKNMKETTSKQPSNTNSNYKKEKNKKILNNNSTNKVEFINNTDNPEKKSPPDPYEPVIVEAYKRFNKLVTDRYPRVKNIPVQMTLTEFRSLMQSYDWDNIIDKLEGLESWDKVTDQEYVYGKIRGFLRNDKGVKKISGIGRNSYYSKWSDRKNREEEKFAEAKKQEEEKRERENRLIQFEEIKDSDIWGEEFSKYDYEERLEEYLAYHNFMDKLRSSEKLSKMYDSASFSFEDYLLFRFPHMGHKNLLDFIGYFEAWDKHKLGKPFFDRFGKFFLWKIKTE